MTTIIFQPLTLADVKVSVDYLPEDLPVRGNYIQSDDKETDKRYEDEVIARLDKGDVLGAVIEQESVNTYRINVDDVDIDEDETC